MSMITSSGTSSPRSLYSCISCPSSVPWFISSRTRSPVSMCVAPVSSSSFAAWVPLPAPCGPMIMILGNFFFLLFSSLPALQKPLVVTHHKLTLELAHRIQRDAYYDQYRHAAEKDRAPQPHDARDNVRHYRDRCQKDRPEERDPGQDVVQIDRCRLPRTYTGDISAALLQVVRMLY